MGWADVLYQFTGEIVPHTATYARGKAVDPNPTAPYRTVSDTKETAIWHHLDGIRVAPGETCDLDTVDIMNLEKRL